MGKVIAYLFLYIYKRTCQGSKLTVAICHLTYLPPIKNMGSKNLLSGNSVMRVIWWKNKQIFTEKVLLFIRQKHNSIWSKALSMFLTTWNFVLS